MRSKSRRGYKAAHCSLFISTPQSRLAPCQLPVWGAFLVWCKLKPKAVPAGGESGHERSEWPKGERLGDTKCRDMFPFRHGLRRDTNAGWNMVVLLRCRLQYSLFRPILPSLHRPLGALGSNPPQAGTAFGLELVPHPKGAPNGELARR